MPSPRYLTPWSPRLNFVAHGRKPSKARLPGLEITVSGKVGQPPRYVWRCCFEGLFSN